MLALLVGIIGYWSIATLIIWAYKSEKRERDKIIKRIKSKRRVIKIKYKNN